MELGSELEADEVADSIDSLRLAIEANIENISLIDDADRYAVALSMKLLAQSLHTILPPGEQCSCCEGSGVKKPPPIIPI